MDIYGFINIKGLTNNNSGQTSLVGELSPLSRTYSKFVEEYTHPSYPAYTLVVFNYSRNALLSDTQLIKIFSKVELASDWLLLHPQPVNMEQLFTYLTDNSGVSSINVGEIQSTGILLPASLRWLEVDRYNIWLSDAHFQKEYPNYEIEVIPPITNIDDFFLDTNQVAYLLSQQSLGGVSKKIYQKRNGVPETHLELLTTIFKYNTTDIPCYWTLLMYGDQGNYKDIYLDAIINYIKVNSTRSINEWINLFPSIFKKTEYFVIPNWSEYSIPNKTSNRSLYSSWVDHRKIVSNVFKYLPDLTISFINNHINVLVTNYNGLVAGIVPGFTNDFNKLDIKTLYPDLLNVPSSHYDYGRMSPLTQQWLIKLGNMLMLAEGLHNVTVTDIDYHKTFRYGKEYYHFTYEGISYLVLIRESGYD